MASQAMSPEADSNLPSFLNNSVKWDPTWVPKRDPDKMNTGNLGGALPVFFLYGFFPGGSAPRPPFSRPSASVMSAFGLQMGPRAPTDPPEWIPQKWVPGTDHSYFPKNPVSFCSMTDLEFWPSPIFFGGHIGLNQTETV